MPGYRWPAVVAMTVMGWLPCSLAPLTAEAAPVIGSGFTLTDHDGRTVTDRSFHGRPVLLYFGFTSCPDVCPTDLARLERIAQRVRQLGGPAVTPIFVSIDPARDTPAKLKAYVALFGSDMVGLTGTPAQVAAVADGYHVYYRKVPYGQKGQYMMDHSTFVFLLDRNGGYLDHFGRTADEAQVARRAVAALSATPASRAARSASAGP